MTKNTHNELIYNKKGWAKLDIVKNKIKYRYIYLCARLLNSRVFGNFAHIANLYMFYGLVLLTYIGWHPL